jgi:hypothetical protein
MSNPIEKTLFDLKLKGFTLRVDTLCKNCNKEYELLLDVGGCNNFSNCIHCGARNDHWIKITPLSVKEG